MKTFTTSQIFRVINCFLFLLCLNSDALSGDDTIFLGDGHSGTLMVNSSNTVINSYAKISANAPAGQDFVTVSATTGFATGDLIMVWLSAGLTFETSSSAPGESDLTNSNTGHWEFARILSLSATKITLTSPLKQAYPLSQKPQAIKVPEYTNVTINASGSIVAKPWDGLTGGILVFLATGTVTNNGAISASGKGFRGGVFSNDGDATTGVSALDQLSPVSGQKGEGIFTDRYGSTYGGRGSFANAGGGGSGFKSGGGGGGSIGAGGNGGNSDLISDGNRSVGGYGGGSLVYPALSRLLMGGGGGAGHSSANSGTAGEAGGGIVFLRAGALAGTGTVSANGNNAPSVTNDGGSGGGAGGFIYIRLTGNAACNQLSATGGTGSSVTSTQIGPGGGGGGGKILFQAAGGSCSNWTVAGGEAGSQGNPEAPGGPSYGATSGNVGSTTTLSGGMIAPVVTITTPTSSSTTPNRPTISGTATPNSMIRIIIDDMLLETVSADVDGQYEYKLTGPQALTTGTHSLRVIADYQGLSSNEVQTSFQADAALPVKIISFTGKQESRTVHLTWDVANEENVEKYVVERSSDGRQFTAINSIAAAAGYLYRATYTTIDYSPLPGENLYRLKMVDSDGSIAYSRLVSQLVDTGFSSVISPNPAIGSAKLSVNGLQKNGGTVSLLNKQGIPVQSYLIPPGRPNWELEIHKNQLPAGIYFVTVNYLTGERVSSTKLIFY